MNGIIDHCLYSQKNKCQYHYQSFLKRYLRRQTKTESSINLIHPINRLGSSEVDRRDKYTESITIYLDLSVRDTRSQYRDYIEAEFRRKGRNILFDSNTVRESPAVTAAREYNRENFEAYPKNLSSYVDSLTLHLIILFYNLIRPLDYFDSRRDGS